MKVLHQDAREGLLRLRIETPDDLWHLQQIVKRGDVVSGLAHREPREAVADRGVERGKVEKRAMWLGVRVESVEFQTFATRLRVLGLIVEGPQDHGMHHTINVEEGSEVAIRKTRWSDHEFARVKEAVEASKRPLVTVLAIEENEAVFAVLRHYGVQKVAEIFGHESGKRFGGGDSGRRDREAFFDEVLLALRQQRGQQETPNPLLVVGPGFTREEFLKHATHREADLVKGALTEPTGQAGMAGVHEALKRGAIGRIAKENRLQEETLLVESLLGAIGRDEPATYGAEYVKSALEAGAVEHLVLTDRVVRDGDGETLLDLARQTGAQATVVSTSHQAGEELQALGGVGALLRYRLGG